MNMIDRIVGTAESDEPSKHHIVWVTGLAFMLGVLFDAIRLPPVWIPARWWLWLVAAGLGWVASTFLPQKRRGLIDALIASIIWILAFVVVNIFFIFVNSLHLSLSTELNYFLFTGPGLGALGLLMPALFTLIMGRWVFGASLTEQWGGTLAFKKESWKYGLMVGVGLAFLSIVLQHLNLTM